MHTLLTQHSRANHATLPTLTLKAQGQGTQEGGHRFSACRWSGWCDYEIIGESWRLVALGLVQDGEESLGLVG